MQLALDDVKIADFTQMMQGGWASQKLADMGADVIKVEPPTGEFNRGLPIGGEFVHDESPFFLAMNRNKRSIQIDLKTEEGLEVARDLVEDADVLMENFRPGVMAKFDLDYETVKEFNPEIIYVSATGYGPDGPYSERPGQDLLVQSLSGFAAQTGRRQDPPTAAGTYIADELSATNLALHTVVALYHRQATGEGQKVEGNLLNALIDSQCQEITAALNMGQSFDRSTTNIAHPYERAPYGIYETKDGYIAIAVAPLEKLGDTLGIAELSEYADDTTAYESRDEVFEIIESHTKERSSDELLETLHADDHWVARVQEYTGLSDDPQVDHNDMLVEVEGYDGEPYTTTGFPVDLSETPGKIRSRPPKAGEHTAQVLDELGYSEDEIEKLVATGALHKADD